MNIEVGSVKGFQDFLPPESQKRNTVRRIIEDNLNKYGFMPIETSMIEFDELMRSDILEGEDEAVSDRFRLRDRAGRNLGLRYELTFQLSRIFKQNPHIRLPIRFSQIGAVFRDEPISQDRFRQITQCDADIIGDSSGLADAECLALLSNILKECKINAEIQINNRKLLNSIIESVEIKNIREVMRELDKKDRIGEDMMKMNLKRYADSNQILTLLKLLEKDLSFFKENAFDGTEELEDLISKAKRYSLALKFNPFLIQGLGYYTGNIFEAVIPGKGSLAGGGRYDKLIGKNLSKKIPAVGISLGLERISQAAKVDISPAKTMIISIEKDSETIRLTRKLRDAGISSIPCFEEISKALEIANSLSTPYVIFIGGEELAKGKYKLRDMKSGEEKMVTEKQLVVELAED